MQLRKVVLKTVLIVAAMMTDGLVSSDVEKCKGINSIIIVNDFTFTFRVVVRPHRTYYEPPDSSASDDPPSSDVLWRGVITDIREKSGKVHSSLK
jgi:hypothetical protein